MDNWLIDQAIYILKQSPGRACPQLDMACSLIKSVKMQKAGDLRLCPMWYQGPQDDRQV